MSKKKFGWSTSSSLSPPTDTQHKQTWWITSVNVAVRKKWVRSRWSWPAPGAGRPCTATRWSRSASVRPQSARFSPQGPQPAGDAEPRTGWNGLWTLTFSQCVATTHYSAVYFLQMKTSWVIIIKKYCFCNLKLLQCLLYHFLQKWENTAKISTSGACEQKEAEQRARERKWERNNVRPSGKLLVFILV